MTDPIAAPISGLSSPALRALCMLAGGSMALLRGVWLDVAGQEHMTVTIDSLVRAKVAERFVFRNVHRVRLTDPRGRWFAATALAVAADILAKREERSVDRLSERISEELSCQPSGIP